jgi:chemotaxis protein MotB
MKHKEDHEEHIDETWLIPYADLLTLLLALFIVLFATSTADQELLTAMKEAFYKEYTGVLPEIESGDPSSGGTNKGPSVVPGYESGSETEENPNNSEQNTNNNEDNTVESGESIEEATANLVSVLQKEFSDYINANNLSAQMNIKAEQEGLLVTLTSDVWFPSGSAEINDSQREIATQIATMIANIQNERQVMLAVIVSGHTDNVPISGTQFPNNWSLSVTRAVNFMEALMNSSSLQPANFSARGFGEYEPISSNDTEEGRRQNRRVEVMISPKFEAN